MPTTGPRLQALLLACAALLTAGRAPAAAEDDPRYLLLATTRTSTMQKELDQMAGKGYRVVVGSPTSGAEMAVLLERVATPPDTWQYRLLATTRTATMQAELDQASRDGYRLLARTMIAKKAALGEPEIVVLLERAPRPDKQYQYRLLATTRTATLQKEIDEALGAGYVITGMVSRGEHMVIMEKETPVP
jgi:hypothetical protein